MPIDFSPNPESCATYGYSYGFDCGDGITHTISQNWRIMRDPNGATFYAPVTSVSSIGSDQGPPGDQGLTGMTGMTGMTGASGATGPQGITFGSSIVGRQSGIVYIPADAVNEPGPDGITLDATEAAASVVFDNSAEYLKISNVIENIPVNSPATGSPTDGFITLSMATSNNFKLDLNQALTGITLSNMSIGDYANIIITQAGPNKLFKSAFECSGYSSTQVNYASGLTYNNGQNTDDIDVFYVSCISGSGSGLAKLLVNHQRYHT